MFLDFYGLEQQPFGVTPDPAYLYPSRTHREALGALRAGIEEGRGFFSLIAEPGMGKTTLLYQLMEDLRERARSVYLFQTQCDTREFFQYLLSELGADSSGAGVVAMHQKLNEILFAEMMSGRRFVLVVDEAQNLREPVLETVRLLSNYETWHTKLLQIVLAGQPPLEQKLCDPRLAQLRQRIAVRCHLEPLSAEETAAYIAHRLRVAGYTGPPLFSPEAYQAIAEFGHGIPRLVNHLCFQALAAAQARALRTISPEIVEEVAAQPSLEPAEVQPEPARVAPPAASPITYQPLREYAFLRGAFRPFLIAAILLLLALFSSLLRVAQPWQETAAALFLGRPASLSAPAISSGPAPVVYSADPYDNSAGQVLTVAAKSRQTIEEICRAYAGRCDGQILGQIAALNPELKDVARLEAGQLIRLPLPRGSLRKGAEIQAPGRSSTAPTRAE